MRASLGLASLAALVLLPALVAAAPPGAALPPEALAPPPSMTTAVVRVVLALGVVSALLLGGVAGHRWLLGRLRPPARGVGGGARGWFARWILPVTDGDRVDVVARSWVGAKESVCLIRAGQDRFLVGVTPQRVSLLGRLDGSAPAPAPRPAATLAAAPPAARAPGPPAGEDFARELAEAARQPAPPAAASPPAVTEDSIRAALAESRQRRARATRAGRPEIHVV
jgi:hypothetical protein